MSRIARSLAPFLIVCLSSHGLLADPPENQTAWPEAPAGFQWDKLGFNGKKLDLNSYQTLLHVSTAGSDKTGNGSQERPWASLGHALKNSAIDSKSAILVAAGIYQENDLQMKSGVDIFGGFDPRNWQRDLVKNSTTLDGGGKGRILLGANNTTLDGFIIEHGKTVGHGGALYCRQVSPTITNNIFRYNLAVEPADYTHDATRRRMRGNNGGAIALDDFSKADIRHNLFISNQTGVGYGGAISAQHDCMPIIAHNVFWGNQAGVNDRNKTMSGNGGAVGLLFSSRAAVFHNLFVENEALGGSDGGGLHCEYFSWPEVRYNAFINNYAGDDGGGIDNQKFSFPKVQFNLFYGNRVDGSGGAMHLDDSVVELENNIIAYNQAASHSGGFGGTHGWWRAVNNTIVFNSVYEADARGGATHHINKKNAFLRPPLMQNNLFWGNTPDQLHLETETTIFYNLVEGGYAESYGNYDRNPYFEKDEMELLVQSQTSDQKTFQSTIRVNQELKPGELLGRIVRIGKFWSMVSGNSERTVTIWGIAPETKDLPFEILSTFHLSPKSEAINRGVYTEFAPIDIDGEPRYTPTIDVGADEYHVREK